MSQLFQGAGCNYLRINRSFFLSENGIGQKCLYDIIDLCNEDARHSNKKFVHRKSFGERTNNEAHRPYNIEISTLAPSVAQEQRMTLFLSDNGWLSKRVFGKGSLLARLKHRAASQRYGPV